MLGVVFRLIYCGCVVYGFLGWGCAVYVSCGYVLRLVLLIFMGRVGFILRYVAVNGCLCWLLLAGLLWVVCVVVLWGSGYLLCGLALYCEVDVTYNAGYFGWCVACTEVLRLIVYWYLLLLIVWMFAVVNSVG